MRRIHIFVMVPLLAMFSLSAVVHSGTDTAPNPNKSSVKLAKLHIEYEDGLLSAVINGASLKKVVQGLEEVTGVKFVLLGDARWANQAIFVQVNKKPLDKALARILRDYSYAVSPMAGSDMPKVTIVLKKGTPPPATARSDASDSLVRSEPSGTSAVTGNKAAGAKRSSDAKKAADVTAYVPYDLDDYMPLLDEGLGDFGPEQDPAGDEPGSVEEQAAREELRQEARLERSLSALDSEHPHLRSMAVEELVGMNDPRATSALESVARSGNVSVDERRQAAQALWHHAADLEFADSAANEALRQLAQGSDPSIQAIAERALTDMERYRRRHSR